MTPPAQKEYIITDKMLKFFASQSFACEQVAAQARPYTGAGSDAVLDKLLKRIQSHKRFEQYPYFFLGDDLEHMIAELRQQTKEDDRR